MGRVIALSDIDEARFGIRTAKVSGLTGEYLPEALSFCEREGVRFLIARCPASDLALVHRLEQDGFLLMDTLVYYRHKDLDSTPLEADPEGLTIRPVEEGEEPLVRAIAAQSFHSYNGHYHADPRLNAGDCDEAYNDWAMRCCALRVQGTNEVLVADALEGLLGFLTLRINTEDEAEVVLNGVAPAAQGRGIYRLLMIRAMEWSRDQGATSMIISTQVTNLAAQKTWVRLGFEPFGSYYTFHRWFD